MKRLLLAVGLFVFATAAYASGHDSGLSPAGTVATPHPGTPSDGKTIDYPRVTTSSNECTDATVMSTYSPRLQFGLDGQHYAFAAFAAEVIRRRGNAPLRCLTVIASCRDASLLKQTFSALKPYGVTHISWQPDKQLFPDKAHTMPECKQ
ncbi:MAG: hypothetical protein ABIR62_17035 [Dokdonella sp.]|uniref:hypothetical protein n=1 Tax=Dokdonella sp. TaxID=2291710 RepID=UPI003266ACC6